VKDFFHATVDPLSTCRHDRVANPLHANAAVMIAANRQYRCYAAKRTNKIPQFAKFGGSVYKVAAE